VMEQRGVVTGGCRPLANGYVAAPVTVN